MEIIRNEKHKQTRQLCLKKKLGRKVTEKAKDGEGLQNLMILVAQQLAILKFYKAEEQEHTSSTEENSFEE